jgi:TolB-like protein
MSLWNELSRRNVIKVGTAYAVAAWLIAQIVSVINEPLGLPAWFDTAVIVLLAIGFPVALILAWVYEVTPEGLKTTREVHPEDSIAHVTGQRLNYVVTGLLIAAVGFMAVDNYLLDDGRGSVATNAPAPPEPIAAPVRATIDVARPARDKVAVLPCDNLSPDPDDAYFALGIHEEILNQLAKIRSLLVVARTSVLRYVDERPGIPEIARQLDATAVVECSVRFAGDDVLVTAQLIDPATDSHVWSETYPGNLSDLGAIFAMQADIAMSIANSLEAEFSPAEQARLGRELTENPEAYSLFLAARATRGADRSLGFLEQAIELDPEFAAAHAGIAFSLAAATLNTISASSTRSWSEIEARARSEAERALALDPNLDTAHGALGTLNQLSWRWDEALASYTRAYELNPNDSGNARALAWFYTFIGEFDEAQRLADRLVALEPNSSGALTGASLPYGHGGRIGEAIDLCDRAIAINPADVFCQHALGMLYARLGNVAEAERQLRLVERLLGTNRFVAFLPQLAVGYSLIGSENDVARIVAEVEAIAQNTDIGAGGRLMLYAGAGDRATALQWLRTGVEKAERGEPDPGYFDLMASKNNVYAVPMLDEPEFRALLARLGSIRR